MTDKEFSSEAEEIADFLGDDITADDVLLAMGIPQESRTAWHRSRVMDALVGPEGQWTAYLTHPGVRFKRRTE